jgi:hypothetical protein
MEDEYAHEPLRRYELIKLSNLTAPFVGIEVGHLHVDEFEIRPEGL